MKTQDHIVFVEELQGEDFQFQYDSRPYSVPAKKTVPLPYYLAAHGMKLANEALNRQDSGRARLRLVDPDAGSLAALKSKAEIAEADAMKAAEEAKAKADVAVAAKRQAELARAELKANVDSAPKKDAKKE